MGCSASAYYDSEDGMKRLEEDWERKKILRVRRLIREREKDLEALRGCRENYEKHNLV